MAYLAYAACLLAFGILMLFVGLGLRAMTPDSLGRVLQQYGAGPHSLEEIEMSRPFGERVVTPILRGIARFVNRLTPQRNMEEMSHLLDVAGNPFNWTVVDFLGLRGLSALVLAVLMSLYLYGANLNLAAKFLYLITAVVIGFYLPLFWLRSRGRARQEEIKKALPDALDLLMISVQAGVGLDAAMQKVTEKWDNQLSRAFARVLAEVRVGKVRRDALHDMANRMDVPDVSNFVAAVTQAEQLGVGIVNVLGVQSERMRILRRQRAQEEAQKAPIKMLFPLILFIFPAMFIIILGPAALRIMSTPIFNGHLR